MGKFIGRENILEKLVNGTRIGKNTLHYVMAGRGMGKTALANEFSRRAGDYSKVVSTGGNFERVTAALVDELKVVPDRFEASFMEAVRSQSGGKRVTLLLDEVERVLDDDRGRGFFDNLQRVWEACTGQLAVVVFGGTQLRDRLVRDSGSPFLSRATPHCLTGFSVDETHAFIDAECDSEGQTKLTESEVNTLHHETNGHPLVLQRVLAKMFENSVDLGSAFQTVRSEYLSKTLFKVWWDNLQPTGQLAYHRVVRAESAIQRIDWKKKIGEEPEHWVEVLESTGVAARDTTDAVLARGHAFAVWVTQNFNGPFEAKSERSAAVVPDDAWIESLFEKNCASEFERLTIRALRTWCRSMLEFPTLAYRARASAAGAGNANLSEESWFQIAALQALAQHNEMQVEAEALSAGPRNRSDLKVRLKGTTDRTIIEFKIWGREHRKVVSQLIGYTLPTDRFAVVVMVDGSNKTLETYKTECLESLSSHPTVEACPPNSWALYSEHSRRDCELPLRVWHFMLSFK